ncbi:hypothetical protein SMICM17S_03599 [Streptomyces microflavus]
MMSPRGVANRSNRTRAFFSCWDSSTRSTCCSQFARSSSASTSSPQKMAMCRNGLFIPLPTQAGPRPATRTAVRAVPTYCDPPVVRMPCRRPPVAPTPRGRASEERRVPVQHPQHLRLTGRGQLEHDLLDAQVRVVGQLAGVREDGVRDHLEVLRVAAGLLLPGRPQLRHGLREAPAADGQPAVRVLRDRREQLRARPAADQCAGADDYGPRGACTGLGYAKLAWTEPNSPSYAVGSADHRARISAIRSRDSSRRVASTPWSAASSTSQP